MPGHEKKTPQGRSQQEESGVELGFHICEELMVILTSLQLGFMPSMVFGGLEAQNKPVVERFWKSSDLFCSPHMRSIAS